MGKDGKMRIPETAAWPARADSEDQVLSISPMTSMGALIAKRLSRRAVVVNAVVAAGGAALGLPLAGTGAGAQATQDRFDFPEIKAGLTADHAVPAGYRAETVIRWGDPVIPGAPAFDAQNQRATAQDELYGYNNDFVAFLPLPLGSTNSDRGLLAINHEYTSKKLMFPNVRKATEETVAIEMAAHGLTVVEVARQGDGSWRYRPDSPYNRRISPRSSEILLSGPVAGHRRVKTGADPSGRRVLGTLNNCAGGVTPWGTSLHAEENFNGYFGGVPAEGPETANHKRYGVPAGWYDWFRFHDRFDLAKEPREPNRFGWVVELDPYDPASTPVKRTALGRFKHEGAESIVNKDGRVVVYMGDDQQFDYLYKFVTAGRFDPNDRAANRDLLDAGDLFVARFDAGGALAWLPIAFGTGPLTPANGFESQADVLIETRRAADLLGATPMDRPEDVTPHPTNGKVYVMLTNNTARRADAVNPANTRGPNPYGHIIELIAPDSDHAAPEARWEILIQAGRPGDPEAQASWHEATTENGWYRAPDNAVIDPDGRLWIATDGNSAGSHSNRNDGLWSLETEGPLRGHSKHFYRCPIGAECCGPAFTPDGETLWIAVQHPAKTGTRNWPDFIEGLPPRPSVIAITKLGGGKIAG